MSGTGRIDRRLFWRRLDGSGVDHATVRHGPGGGGASGASVAVADGQGYAVRWHVVWDRLWRTRAVRVERLDRVPSLLDLAVDEEAVWRDPGGRELRQLRGCLDVDVACTPFTNTLPIRRLTLAEGASAEIQAAFLDLPALTASHRAHRYTRLSSNRFRYESIADGFSAELELDPDDLVLSYHGLFARIVEV